MEDSRYAFLTEPLHPSDLHRDESFTAPIGVMRINTSDEPAPMKEDRMKVLGSMVCKLVLGLSLFALAGVILHVVRHNTFPDTSPLAAATPSARHEAVVLPVQQLSKLISHELPSHLLRPQKFLLDGLTPTDDQMMRGDCWLFALGGVLEDSYRRYGVQRGWLAADKWVRLSKQALGIAVMEACTKKPSALCPATASGDGKVHWGGTTTGADERMLYYMTALGEMGAFPGEVCNYTATAVGEAECSGLAKARQTNPLHFNVTAAQTLHEAIDMKAALLESRRVLTIGTPVLSNEFFLPCTEKTAAAYRCNPHDERRCVPCPLERAYGGVGCCIAVQRPMVTMRGEWYHRPGGRAILAGAHAINVVGYTDTYRDEHGNMGGLIVRNSWDDGLGAAHGSIGRGSHSAHYFMHMVSDHDEARACPNPHSPRSWAPCKDLAECHSPVTRAYAEAARRPLLLKCIDNGGALVPGLMCDTASAYFLANLTEWDSGGLFVGCFHRDPPNDAAAAAAAADKWPASVCMPPLVIDDLSSLFTPKDIPDLNNPDVCQYNFIPYTTLALMQSRYGITEHVAATDYTIEWARSSYASQANDFGEKGYDYGLLEKSTHDMPKIAAQAGAMWQY